MFHLSLLDFSSSHLLLCELSQAVEVPLAAVLDAGIGSGLEELQGGVPGHILSWKVNEKVVFLAQNGNKSNTFLTKYGKVTKNFY